MLKNGAPPDKLTVLYRLFPVKFHFLTADFFFRIINPLVSGQYLNVLETVSVLLTLNLFVFLLSFSYFLQKPVVLGEVRMPAIDVVELVTWRPTAMLKLM